MKKSPAHYNFTVAGLATGNPCPYQIFSLTGQLMASGNVTNGTSLTISHLKPGLYILMVLSSNEVISRKFVRE